MLAVGFVDRHFVTPLARSGEGEKVKAFARVVGGKLGNDPFAVYEMNELAGECYLGRLGLPCRSAREVVALPGNRR